MLKRIGLVGLVLLLVAVAYLALWPVPIDPQAWTPPDAAARAWAPTGDLAGAVRVPLPDDHGPEDVELDDLGRVVVGLADGRLLRWPEGGVGTPELLADTGGRPLGLHPGPQGSLYVADAYRGLLRVDAAGAITVLTTTCADKPLVFTDDLETTADGRVWFTDATSRFPQKEWKLDLLENGPHGRLCVFDPGTGRTEEALTGLFFANGVAVDPGQQFVLLNETSRYRVTRLWIDGPRKGQHEVVLDNLPGFPDGISTGTRGRFWVAIASPRNPAVDKAGPAPWMRKVMVRLPKALQPKPARTARLLGISGDGEVVHDLFDPTGTPIHVVTSVQERGGRLYLGSLVDEAWAWVPVPDGEASPVAAPPEPAPPDPERVDGGPAESLPAAAP